jgi:iron complex transport system permease protein
MTPGPSNPADRPPSGGAAVAALGTVAPDGPRVPAGPVAQERAHGQRRRGAPSRLGLGLGVVAVVVGACGIGLAAGSSGFGFVDAQVMWQIRLPRVLAGFGAGAALALAGALLQQLTRNALADPYVLGVSSGASVAALAWMMVAPGVLAGMLGSAGLLAAAAGVLQGPAGVALAAAVGAAAAVALLLALSWRVVGMSGRFGAGDTPVAVLLLGVMIGSGAAALVSLMLALAPEAQLRGMVFWLLGDLNGAIHWVPAWVGVGLAVLMVAPVARSLDRLARGEAWAATLGVNVPALQRRVLGAAALATGTAVATAGAIGFVGLVVPQALRLLGVRTVAALLPASAAAGGAFVVLADALARTAAAPLQLPVGVVCAAVGVPVFIALLLRGSAARGLR